MDMKAFSDENVARCTAPNGFNHPLDSWSLSDWMVATMGEMGEAANVLKKLNRVRDGIPGNSETPAQLEAMFLDELADTYMYIDLMCRSMARDTPWSDTHDRELSLPLSDSMTHAMSMLGMAASCVMLGRVATDAFRDGVIGVIVALREMATMYGTPLEVAIRSKFDRTSGKIGYVP